MSEGVYLHSVSPDVIFSVAIACNVLFISLLCIQTFDAFCPRFYFFIVESINCCDDFTVIGDWPIKYRVYFRIWSACVDSSGIKKKKGKKARCMRKLINKNELLYTNLIFFPSINIF